MRLLLNTLCGADGAVSFCWAGNAGWLISDGNHLIGIDLDLMSERLWALPVDMAELARRLDFALATHAHGDHFNTPTAKCLIENSRCTLVLPKSCGAEAERAGIPESRILWAAPRLPLAPAPWLRLEPARAIHGHIGRSVYSEASFDDCGYLITLGGKRLFHPGDSVLLQEHLEIADIDVLFISPTEHNTHIDGSRALIEAVNPARIFAQHFGTYPVTDENAFWTAGYEEPLRLALSAKHRNRYVIPEPGVAYRAS